MKTYKKISIGFIVLLVTLALIPISSKADSSIYFYDPFPQGNIGISLPEIGWTVFLEGNRVEDVQFYLNSKPISVNYNEESETFYAIPTELLSGTNTVKARIKIKNWSNVIEKTWTFTVDKNSLQNLPFPDNQQLTAMNYANDYRYIINNPLYQFNNSLNMSAQKHADYQADLNVFSHYQEKGTTGYFGQTVTNRANYYGFFGSVSEDISFQTSPSIQESVDSLFDAPYHRIPFLMPSYNYFGYGISGYYHDINFGSSEKKGTKFVAYPAASQNHVPITWRNFETPNPLRFYSKVPNEVGYPIVVGIYGKEVTGVTLVSAELLDEKKEQVSLYINSPEDTGGNDGELHKEVFLIPKKPLNIGSKYTVKIQLKANLKNGTTENYNKEWSFNTEKVKGMGKEQLHGKIVYPSYIENAKKIKFRIGQKYISVDGNDYPLDVVPFIENNRSMVPFRALGNSLGAKVDWNGTTKTIIYKTDSMVIELPVAKNVVKINGITYKIDQGAIIRNDRSFVPTRFISEQLGANVIWISEKQEVTVLGD